jgi:D-glycero-D-manno-heptose 1,7-bisphosphate phosphatase
MKKLIILDRDGVINQDSPEFIKSPAEWQPIPNSLEAIAKLNKAGFIVTVATNQSGIGRGLFTPQQLALIHEKMKTELNKVGGHLEGIYICPHQPETCECRKPKPGLLNQILQDFSVNPLQTPVCVLGDSLRDLEAAKAASCIPMLVLTGNGEKTRKDLPDAFKTIPVFNNLAEAVTTLINDEEITL